VIEEDMLKNLIGPQVINYERQTIRGERPID